MPAAAVIAGGPGEASTSDTARSATALEATLGSQPRALNA